MTAVEWLVDELSNGDWYYLSQSMILEIVEQAKEMEKQQIIDAFEAEKRSIISHNYNDRSVIVSYISSEQYYNETFKNTNKEL